MTKLVLIRHGESAWNKENRFTGWTDVDLTEKGIEEAIQGGKLLKEADFDFDIAYTSYLKRAIHTLDRVLNELDRVWLPVHKHWRLNERHYGALQGLNKQETAEKYGDEQVLLWRRSFNVLPPELNLDDPRAPRNDETYRDVEDKSTLPLNESLETTIQRVLPYWNNEIKPKMVEGKRVLIVAHGNSIRALVKHLEKLSEEEIMGVNIPTGIPLIYQFDDYFNIIDKYYLGDQQAIEAKMKAVAAQGSSRKD
ncbi:phosphoglyceromutase [Erysipelothrix larvae]|uniref:2,3-bisphosphoglycerate-dependent phosphoglycerate mutase n=1 Tax=Erysipelothrix larvae TaxID=1514105 RepID=A0A120JTJ2_9FIRM|nr:2,3-diphosphoglycerate-dependent phosphoglycerate mutase [Erysipelothrix larvae]AMC93063.1 phosphoglyceromutase [Erysipelothrix larvae]